MIKLLIIGDKVLALTGDNFFRICPTHTNTMQVTMFRINWVNPNVSFEC
jgi:hypothetical protein